MIYVMSDIHGHQEAFDDILSQIQLSDHDHLYILGDVIDRGPDGIELCKESVKCLKPRSCWGTTNI